MTGRFRPNRRRLVWIAAAALAGWLLFFDSHSLVQRFAWHGELRDVRADNVRLAAEIERLEQELERGLSDETVERIARGEYGMRRPGEQVFRVIPE